jgi:hypothetical protein
MAIITLTTDFGTRDGYVGAVKGVILRDAPRAQIVDLAHDIPAGDIAHAAWVVATSTREFPHGSIHVVVVDPGVGGARQGVVGKIPVKPPRGEQYYVGPDNGVFAYLPIEEVRAIDNAQAIAPDVSATFHGRDVFAPVAAALANDRPMGFFGSRSKLSGRLPWGERAPGTGRVVHVDRFGNLITDLPAAEAGNHVAVAGHHLRVRRTYQDVASGLLLAYVGSAGTIEIAIRDGRADSLGIERGVPVLPAGTEQGPYR